MILIYLLGKLLLTFTFGECMIKVILTRRRIEKQYEDLARYFGKEKAKAIKKRLNELLAANNLHGIKLLPQVRLHPLRSGRSGQIALKTIGKYRMIIEPRGEYNLADYRTITEVEIVEFDVDYHR